MRAKPVPPLFQFQKKRQREFSGKLQVLNLLLLGLTVAFHIVVALMPLAGPLEQRAIHVALFCAIVLGTTQFYADFRSPRPWRSTLAS